MWIAAQQQGVGVQPISPVFRYAHTDQDLDELVVNHLAALRDLQREFRALSKPAPTRRKP
ncbi:hypothetical protein F0Q45_26315 [Mycobacterium simiae]|uniref:Uncharacterized protein n=1 Tax=Mycobacterium simiae TaxID=1784 RepID=A0A5B1B469_MYCSI|nr:hypothetical protein [Mycobacterium simiae]KAA1242430.1 hypothetical protein F0Q45_26315 [Mycobacterium simiae]